MAVRSRIQEILEDNKGKKFSIPDLVSEFEKDGKKAYRANLHKAMQKLVEEKKVIEEKGTSRRDPSRFFIKSLQSLQKTTTITTKNDAEPLQSLQKPLQSLQKNRIKEAAERTVFDQTPRIQVLEEEIKIWEKKFKSASTEINTLKMKLKTQARPKIITQKINIPDFNLFMEKLNTSNSYSAQHLKEKLFVRGKFKGVNKERVIRVIRDVIDIIKE